jgi:5-(carboxyamino)imidazole ribonucleotide synthase
MTIIKPGSTIGIIGGGQLGRMSALAAANLGYKVNSFTDKQNSPASYVSNKTIVASYDDLEAIDQFTKDVDVVTFEFENIPYKTLQRIENNILVRPNWQLLHTSQNRLREKNFINTAGIKTAPYTEIRSLDDLKNAHREYNCNSILKTVEFGYDGKGQYSLNSQSDIEQIWKQINTEVAILEEKINFSKEISVIVARGTDGKSMPFAAAENYHVNGILSTTIAPANISDELAIEAKNIAIKLANAFELVGILAIEMFVTKNDKILINEIAPRPHNSGHWTMDGCVTSQFEQFIRAICGLPLGDCRYHSKVRMINLIGDDVKLWEKHISKPNSKIHLYGKTEIQQGRKLGHINELYDN